MFKNNKIPNSKHKNLNLTIIIIKIIPKNKKKMNNKINSNKTNRMIPNSNNKIDKCSTIIKNFRSIIM